RRRRAGALRPRARPRVREGRRLLAAGLPAWVPPEPELRPARQREARRRRVPRGAALLAWLDLGRPRRGRRAPLSGEAGAREARGAQRPRAARHRGPQAVPRRRALAAPGARDRGRLVARATARV